MTLPASVSEWRVDERIVPAVDQAAGIDRRWEVRRTDTGAMRVVILTKRRAGRFGGPAQFLCSCGLSALLHPCEHVKAVAATLPSAMA